MGEGHKLVEAEATTYGGTGPVVNPSGGLISKGHPLGATGLAQCAELTWQLRGTADARQVDGAARGAPAQHRPRRRGRRRRLPQGGMSVLVTDELKDYRESYATFLRREVVPHYDEWHAAQIVPRSLFTQCAEFGFLAMEVPEELGGPGVDDWRFNCVLAEEAVQGRRRGRDGRARCCTRTSSCRTSCSRRRRSSASAGCRGSPRGRRSSPSR